MLMPGVDRLSQLLSVSAVTAVLTGAELVEDRVRFTRGEVLDASQRASATSEPTDERATLRLAFLISAEVRTANGDGKSLHLLTGDRLNNRLRGLLNVSGWLLDAVLHVNHVALLINLRAQLLRHVNRAAEHVRAEPLHAIAHGPCEQHVPGELVQILSASSLRFLNREAADADAFLTLEELDLADFCGHLPDAVIVFAAALDLRGHEASANGGFALDDVDAVHGVERLNAPTLTGKNLHASLVSVFGVFEVAAAGHHLRDPRDIINSAQDDAWRLCGQFLLVTHSSVPPRRRSSACLSLLSDSSSLNWCAALAASERRNELELVAAFRATTSRARRLRAAVACGCR